MTFLRRSLAMVCLLVPLLYAASVQAGLLGLLS